VNAKNTEDAVTGKAVAEYVEQNGGANVVAGNNVTIDTMSNGQKRINAQLPAGITSDAGSVSFNENATYASGTVGKKIQDLANSSDGNIFSLFPQKDYLPRMSTLRKKTPFGYKPLYTPLVLVWFSDLHGDLENLSRIIEWREYYQSYIDDILNTGDTVTDNINNQANLTGLANYFNNGGDNILTAIGNHDAASDTSYKGYGGQKDMHDIYELFTARMNIGGLGIVQPENAAGNGYNYYYKDYYDRGQGGIRLFVLDECIQANLVEKYCVKEDKEQRYIEAQAYEEAQYNWFINNVRLALNNGLSVIVAGHFGRKIEPFVSESGFINATKPLGTSVGTTIPERYLTAIDSFIDEGLDFIGWLGGHVHEDYMGALIDHPKQILICITTAAKRLDTAQSGEPSRIAGTSTQDAFNVIAFDSYYKRIKVVRVGYNFDAYGRHIDMITIDYKNVKLIR
jgi:hypothetical protein